MTRWRPEYGIDDPFSLIRRFSRLRCRFGNHIWRGWMPPDQKPFDRCGACGKERA